MGIHRWLPCEAIATCSACELLACVIQSCISGTTLYKQGLEPGISFHCLCDDLVQTRSETRHFISLSLGLLVTTKASNPIFHFIVRGTTCYKQGLKPDISFHCLWDYLVQRRPETRHFISLSQGLLCTNKAWNPAFRFIVSVTTWYKQGMKPGISFHCLNDYLVQTRSETRHFISLSLGLLVTTKASNPISFHCPRDYLLQTRPETRHFISLSLGLLGTKKAWNPAFHFIVSGTTLYKQGLEPGISFHCLCDDLVQTRYETRHFISLSQRLFGTNKAWNPAFYFISRSIEDRGVIARFSVLYRWFWHHCLGACCLPSYPGLSPGSARKGTSGSGWRPWRKGQCGKIRKLKVKKIFFRF